MNTSWHLAPGDTILRTQLHHLYGGRRQGGVSPSRQSPNVMLFSDPVTGARHGYFDDWQGDGCFHYTGEGQRGDQEMDQGNLQILNHAADGRALRVFKRSSGEVEYVDEFELDKVQPFYETDAPETGGGPIRKVIVFRLRPLTISPQQPTAPLAAATSSSVDRVPIEEQNTERAYVDPSREPYEAERREAALVRRFRDFLVANGHEVSRLRIVPPGEAKPIFSDLLDESADVLVEAKGSITRESMRMAIGQLADYARFSPGSTKAILMPESPRPDLLALAEGEGLLVVWPQDEAFVVAGGNDWW